MSWLTTLGLPPSIAQSVHVWRGDAVLRACAGFGVGAYLAHWAWYQYSVLLDRNCPHYSLECPVLGCWIGLLRHGYVQWARSMLKRQPAVLTHFMGYNGVMVTWPLYEKYVKKADVGGEMGQGDFPKSMVELFGEHSIVMMQAGKGQEKHRRLRSKVLDAMTPKRVLAMVPQMTVVIRDILDRMADDTVANGFAKFGPYANELVRRVVSVPIAGGGAPAVEERLAKLTADLVAGMIALPIDLGRFSAFGRAKRARAELAELIRDLLHGAEGCRGNIIADLATSTAEGAGFTEVELVDTVATLVLAGQITTVEVLPQLLFELCRRPDWATQIAAEPTEFDQCEGDGATARFVREVLRHHPPEVFLFRKNMVCPISLGEHGHIPAGCNAMLNFGDAMWRMGEDFDPDRWTHDVARDGFLSFGGSSPHSCVGRTVAMVELQLFARILCREYDVGLVEAKRVRNWQLGGILFGFQDGCRVRVSKKA